MQSEGEEKGNTSLQAGAGLAMFVVAPFLGHAVWSVYGLVRRALVEPVFFAGTISEFASGFTFLYMLTLIGAYIIGIIPSAIGTLIYKRWTNGVRKISQRLITATLIGFFLSAAMFLPASTPSYYQCILAGTVAAAAAAFLFDRSRETSDA